MRLKSRGDFGEFIDERWKDVSRLARIRVISLAEKRPNELIFIIECFTDRMSQRCLADSG
jgi:hypothetical protein